MTDNPPSAEDLAEEIWALMKTSGYSKQRTYDTLVALLQTFRDDGVREYYSGSEIKKILSEQIEQEAYQQGFEEAKERAAKIAEKTIRDDGLDCYKCDCCRECPQKYYPPLIRALQPTKENI